MRSKKKAQVQGQVIVYVLALVVVSLILLYGYNAIKSFRARANDVEAVQFRTEIQSAVKALSSDTGTFRKMEFFVPESITEVCFADTRDGGGREFILGNPPGEFSAYFNARYPYICDAICGECDSNTRGTVTACDRMTDNNIFLRSKERLMDQFTIGSIAIYVDPALQKYPDFRCFDVNQGILRIKMTGLGKATEIAGWED